MESVDTSNSQAKSFFGTFVLIYAVLNIVAFFIMLLTTEWSILTDDEGSPLWASVIFMTMGMIAALFCGVGPALVLSKKRKSGWTKLISV